MSKMTYPWNAMVDCGLPRYVHDKNGIPMESYLDA